VPGRPGRLNISQALRIFSLFIADSSLHEKLVSSHCYVLTTKLQIALAFTSHFRIVTSQLKALCHLRGSWNLEVVPRYLEKV
jgi:hypothetical protein